MRRLKIESLNQDPENARIHSDDNIEAIRTSIGLVGAGRSIVIDEDGVILAGNATVKAAEAAGIKEVQVVETDGDVLVAVRRRGLTREQRKQLAYADNRASELADWNLEQISADLNDGIELSSIWSREELDGMLEAPKPPGPGEGSKRPRRRKRSGATLSKRSYSPGARSSTSGGRARWRW